MSATQLLTLKPSLRNRKVEWTRFDQIHPDMFDEEEHQDVLSLLQESTDKEIAEIHHIRIYRPYSLENASRAMDYIYSQFWYRGLRADAVEINIGTLRDPLYVTHEGIQEYVKDQRAPRRYRKWGNAYHFLVAKYEEADCAVEIPDRAMELANRREKTRSKPKMSFAQAVNQKAAEQYAWQKSQEEMARPEMRTWADFYEKQ